MKTWTNANHPTLAGPWAGEPDKAQWVDEATGLDCLVLRNHMWALCGYVGLPPGHPAHGVDYGDVEPEPDVHGGLTFSDFCQEGAPEGHGICHIPEPGRPERIWWLGFDCGHAFDLHPRLVLYGEDLHGGTYRTFDYVRGECSLLATQLHNLT